MKSLTLLCILLALGGIRSETSNITEEQLEPSFPDSGENRTSNGRRCASTLSGDEECESQTTDVVDNQYVLAYKLFNNTFKKYVDPVIAVFALVSAVLSILVVRRSSLKSSTSVYILGLTSSDVISIIIFLAFQIPEYEIIYSLTSVKNLYCYLFFIIYALNFVTVTSYSWVVLAFATERLIAINCPLKAHIVSSESRAKKIVVAIFCLAIIINIGQPLKFKVDVRTDPTTNETLHVSTFSEIGLNIQTTRAIYLLFAIPSLLVPFPLMAIITGIIMFKLRVANKARSSLQGLAPHSKTSKQAQTERLLVGSLCAYLFCNVVAASNVLTVASHGSSIFRDFIMEFRIRLTLGRTLHLCNPILSFLVYVYSSQSLRDSLKELFGVKEDKTAPTLSTGRPTSNLAV